MRHSPIFLAFSFAAAALLSAGLLCAQSNTVQIDAVRINAAQSNSPVPKQSSGIQSNPVAPESHGTATPQPGVPASPESGNNQEPPQPPSQPKTEILDSSATSAGALSTGGHDPVLDPPPLPTGATTLVGGVVTAVDYIRNQMIVSVFGGGRWKIGFDERTRIFNKSGAETTELAIKKGERVYVDTMLDHVRHEVLARNIRLGAASGPADASGQITGVDTAHGIVTLHDQVASVPVEFRVDQDTRITYGKTAASFNDLKPGSLVHVTFSPDRSHRGLAREIVVMASPGSSFTFVGAITHLDLHLGMLALQSLTDDKNYAIHFDPARTAARDSLGVGVQVRVEALFDGSQYSAQAIHVTQPAEAAAK